MKKDEIKELNYSSNVYELRKQKGVTQARMAEDLGITTRTIRNIEYGQSAMTLGLAYRISAYFNKILPEVFPACDELYLKKDATDNE